MPKHRLLRISALTLFLVAVDQISKFWVRSNFSLGESRPVIKPILYWTYHINTGAAFGLAHKLPALLTWVSALFVVAIAAWFIIKRNEPSFRAGAWTPVLLIFAGAIGNGIDRYRYGYVIDFIDLRVWPVFNAADSMITVGAVLLVAGQFFRRGKS